LRAKNNRKAEDWKIGRLAKTTTTAKDGRLED